MLGQNVPGQNIPIYTVSQLKWYKFKRLYLLHRLSKVSRLSIHARSNILLTGEVTFDTIFFYSITQDGDANIYSRPRIHIRIYIRPRLYIRGRHLGWCVKDGVESYRNQLSRIYIRDHEYIFEYIFDHDYDIRGRHLGWCKRRWCRKLIAPTLEVCYFVHGYLHLLHPIFLIFYSNVLGWCKNMSAEFKVIRLSQLRDTAILNLNEYQN